MSWVLGQCHSMTPSLLFPVARERIPAGKHPSAACHAGTMASAQWAGAPAMRPRFHAGERWTITREETCNAAASTAWAHVRGFTGPHLNRNQWNEEGLSPCFGRWDIVRQKRYQNSWWNSSFWKILDKPLLSPDSQDWAFLFLSATLHGCSSVDTRLSSTWQTAVCIKHHISHAVCDNRKLGERLAAFGKDFCVWSYCLNLNLLKHNLLQWSFRKI